VKNSDGVFHLAAEYGLLDTVDESAPSESSDETTHRVNAGDIGALTTLGTYVPPIGKIRYTWTGSHLIREPLETSGFKKGAARKVQE
jgi:hypothetical protein